MTTLTRTKHYSQDNDNTRYYTVLAVRADGAGEHQIMRRAASLSEALARAERDDAGVGEFSTFGVLPEDYEQARAEGIEFNEADGLLL